MVNNPFPRYKAQLGRVNQYNLQTLRSSPAAEISGALGDLGTLLPLMITLAIHGSIDLPTTLVLTGVFNIVTGATFGIPLPVQPMKFAKAIAAAAIAQKSPLAETTAAGGWVGIAVLFLSLTGLIRWLTTHIPAPVVRGIQLGAGLQLIISAGSSLILPVGWLAPLLDNRTWALVAFFALPVVMVAPPGKPKARTPPYALLVFFTGICFSLLSIALLEPGRGESGDGGGGGGPPTLPSFSIWHPIINVPDFLSPSSISMALSQLPLTTLNSIIAVCALAEDLFPPPPPSSSPLSTPESSLPTPSTSTMPSPSTVAIKFPPSAAPPSATSLGISVALMNLIACFTGCMPVCHGSGGLAGQYKFGARSGASVVMLGLLKVFLGVFLGNSLIDLLDSFPRGLLGVMVFAAGLELARAGTVGLDDFSSRPGDREEEEEEVEDEDCGGGGSCSHSQRADASGSDSGQDGREQGNKGTMTSIKSQIRGHPTLSEGERNERWTVMLMTAGGILASKNDAVGFLAGLLCHGAYKLAAVESESLSVLEEGLGDDGPEPAARLRPTPTHAKRRRPSGAAGKKYYFFSGRRRQRPSGPKQTHTRRGTDGEESPLLGSD